MAHNAGFKFIFQRSAKTAPQPKPPDSPHGNVRVLMQNGKWLVKPGERPELRNTGSAARSSSE
jgi:hypothetical protein